MVLILQILQLFIILSYIQLELPLISHESILPGYSFLVNFLGALVELVLLELIVFDLFYSYLNLLIIECIDLLQTLSRFSDFQNLIS